MMTFWLHFSKKILWCFKKSFFKSLSDKISSKRNNSYKVWWVLLNVFYSLNSFQIASHIMQIHKKLPTLKNEKSSTNNTCGSLVLVLINVIAPNRIFQLFAQTSCAIFNREMRSWQQHEIKGLKGLPLRS